MIKAIPVFKRTCQALVIGYKNAIMIIAGIQKNQWTTF